MNDDEEENELKICLREEFKEISMLQIGEISFNEMKALLILFPVESKKKFVEIEV